MDDIMFSSINSNLPWHGFLGEGVVLPAKGADSCISRPGSPSHSLLLNSAAFLCLFIGIEIQIESILSAQKRNVIKICDISFLLLLKTLFYFASSRFKLEAALATFFLGSNFFSFVLVPFAICS